MTGRVNHVLRVCIKAFAQYFLIHIDQQVVGSCMYVFMCNQRGLTSGNQGNSQYTRYPACVFRAHF